MISQSILSSAKRNLDEVAMATVLFGYGIAVVVQVVRDYLLPIL